jgi:hypothetical protein
LITFGLLTVLGIHNARNNDFETAIAYAVRGLNIAIGWESLDWMGYGRDVLIRIYLQMGQEDQARRQILDSLEWHLAIGQVWQTLGFFWSEAVKHAQLIGGNDMAVAILSMVWHHPESMAYYREQVELALPAFVEGMEAEEYERAWARGRRLAFEDAVAQMRQILTTGSDESEK